MGILNLTPDSFSHDGLVSSSGNFARRAVAKAERMIRQGAAILDIGGESSRPGAAKVSEQEEINRVIPILKFLAKKCKIPISIDTYKALVARQVLNAGADMINSLGGFTFDPELAAVVKEYGCPIAIYHVKGTPQTMQQGEIVYEDVIGDISKFFEEQIAYGMSRAVKREQFIIDPGIGFGKTLGHNLEIIKRLAEFGRLELPMLIGVSRKSHLGTLLQEALGRKEIVPPEERLGASLAETAVAVLNGVHIVRTHDVAETEKFLAVIDAIKKL